MLNLIHVFLLKYSKATRLSIILTDVNEYEAQEECIRYIVYNYGYIWIICISPRMRYLIFRSSDRSRSTAASNYYIAASLNVSIWSVVLKHLWDETRCLFFSRAYLFRNRGIFDNCVCYINMYLTSSHVAHEADRQPQ